MKYRPFLFYLFLFSATAIELKAQSRGRLDDFHIRIGVLPKGQWNAITDVAGVRVGHVTMIKSDSIRTGATAILPHGDNLFQQKVPAAIFAGNGFGKLAGV